YPSENVSWDEVMDSMTEDDHHLPRFPSLDETIAKNYMQKTIPVYQPLVHMIALSKILGIILKNLYTPKGKKYCVEHGSDSIIGYLDNSLSKWRTNLPQPLDIHSPGKTNLHNEEHIAIISMTGMGLLSLSYYVVLILLHRPFVRNDTDNDRSKLSSKTSLAICTSAANKILDISHNMPYRDFLLLSWGYTFYPIVTATLIHAFNAHSPDKVISETAKLKLAQSLAFIDKVCPLLSAEDGIEKLLRKKLLYSQEPKLLENQNMQQGLDTSKANTNNLNSQNTLHEQTSSLLIDDYNWLDQLFVSSQQNPIQNDQCSSIEQNNIWQCPAVSEDMYSIRQFGFNTVNSILDFQQPQYTPYIENTLVQNHPYVGHEQTLNQGTRLGLPSGDTTNNTTANVYNTYNTFTDNVYIEQPSFSDVDYNADYSFWGVPDDNNVGDWFM
ncbi:hypothetical protein CU098_013239, partial [Rhizopus stolonifer]